MKVKVISFLIFSILSIPNCFSQGLDNNWLLGFDTQFIPPWGGLKIDFATGIPVNDTTGFNMEFKMTHSNISDTNGNLLLYTNGYYIANAVHDTMQNGAGLNPSDYTNLFSDGLRIPQANVIIPKPETDSIYYLFHSTIDTSVFAKYLYLTIVDISQSNGLGAVINKNQIIISDYLNNGKVSAVKHGNGRDWWVVCHKLNTNIFYKILVTPNGVESVTTQSIGIIRPPDTNQAGFSKDGTKYAYHWFEDGAEVFDFDRCTGLFSNPILLYLGTNWGLGVEFSPNSELLYLSASDSLFQFDLTATDIFASKQLVAVYDSFLYTIGYVSVPTLIELMKLAPDGKIYITTGNSTQYMHVINQPDSLGTACDVQQHSLFLPRIYSNTLPNHPNYHLGPLVGSICDTVYTGIPPPEQNLTLKLYPNPNSGTFQITYTPLPENLQLQVFNILGELVHTQLLPQWSQLQNITVPNLSPGVYMAKISSSKSSKSLKFLVE